MIQDFWKKNVKVGQCGKRESCCEPEVKATNYDALFYFLAFLTSFWLLSSLESRITLLNGGPLNFSCKCSSFT